MPEGVARTSPHRRRLMIIVGRVMARHIGRDARNGPSLGNGGRLFFDEVHCRGSTREYFRLQVSEDLTQGEGGGVVDGGLGGGVR